MCVALAAVLVGGLLAGCSAGTPPSPPGPEPTASPSSTPFPLPTDGVSLVTLGLQNGPREFTVPRAAVLAQVVDQANNVVLVLRAPPGDEVSDYLRRTLPGAGFAITAADPDGATFTFDGHGWTGSFTSGNGTSAVLLRPV